MVDTTVMSREVARISGTTNPAAPTIANEVRILIDAAGRLQIDVVNVVLTDVGDALESVGLDFLATTMYGWDSVAPAWSVLEVNAAGEIYVQITDGISEARFEQDDGNIPFDTGRDLIVIGKTYAFDAVTPRWLRTELIAAGGDGISNIYNQFIVAGMNYAFNGVNWDSLRNDPITMSLRIIDAEHAEIHAEDHYFVSDPDIDIDAAAPKYWRVTSPNSAVRIHFSFTVSINDSALIEVFENPTIVFAGIRMTEYNNDRNSGNTPDLTTWRDTTINVEGTLLASEYVGSAGAGASGGIGGIKHRGQEIILEQNQDYTIKVTTDNDNVQASIIMMWYEE